MLKKSECRTIQSTKEENYDIIIFMSIEQNINAEIPQNAISVYRQDNAMDDFPVLKAFQQYIDAEQIKSRKRMVSLCIFFGILMTIVIAVFMMMLHQINSRNQQLNDRLVEYAMRDRQQPVAPQPIIQQVPPANAANEAAMRAMTDTLVALQKQIAEQQKQQGVATAAPVQFAQTPEEAELERKTQVATEKLRKARALLDAEKKKLAEEREKMRQEEVERHRRRLYPEYYKQAEAPQPAAAVPQPAVVPQPQQSAQGTFSDDDIAEILREVDEVRAANEKQIDEEIDDDFEDAIEYFKDDEYEIPVEVKGTSAKWHVPLD